MSRIDCGKYKCLEEGTAACSNEQCVCKDGYTGDECVVKTCPGETPAGVPCNAHGTCNGTTCRCDPNWYGLGCETYCDYKTTCSGHGVCIGSRGGNNPPERLGKCLCNKPWYGEKCSQKPPDPPSACKKMGNCGRGGGYIFTDEYREQEYINDPIFSGIDNINWNTDPPTSTCRCDCKIGYYMGVTDPKDHSNWAEWRWGLPHPFDPSHKPAPQYGIASTGISTNTDQDGKCLPCPPGYYIETIKDGIFTGKTVCKRCGCPSVSSDKGKTKQHFAKKSTNAPLSASQVCSGGGTSPTGDADLIQSLGAACIPEELWCDNHKCHVKKSDAPCSLANRKCPAYYTDYGTGDDMCFPGWSVRNCIYEH